MSSSLPWSFSPHVPFEIYFPTVLSSPSSLQMPHFTWSCSLNINHVPSLSTTITTSSRTSPSSFNTHLKISKDLHHPQPSIHFLLLHTMGLAIINTNSHCEMQIVLCSSIFCHVFAANSWTHRKFGNPCILHH
jgi:hypothetical protein